MCNSSFGDLPHETVGLLLEILGEVASEYYLQSAYARSGHAEALACQKFTAQHAGE